MKIDGKRGRLRVAHKPDDFNPMEGVGNMADAMLVFACGILMALILSWNISVSESGELTSADSTADGQSGEDAYDGSEYDYEIDGLDDTASEELDSNTDLQEIGTVYMDPQTGKYYVMEDGYADDSVIDNYTDDGSTDTDLDTNSDPGSDTDTSTGTDTDTSTGTDNSSDTSNSMTPNNSTDTNNNNDSTTNPDTSDMVPIT